MMVYVQNQKLGGNVIMDICKIVDDYFAIIK